MGSGYLPFCVQHRNGNHHFPRFAGGYHHSLAPLLDPIGKPATVLQPNLFYESGDRLNGLSLFTLLRLHVVSNSWNHAKPDRCYYFLVTMWSVDGMVGEEVRGERGQKTGRNTTFNS